MAAAGPTQILFYLNRSDSCGWSLKFVTSTASLITAERQSENLRDVILNSLSKDVTLVGARYTDTANPRLSILRRYALSATGPGKLETPDERTVCASFNLANALGQKETRTFRGLPDDYVNWDENANQMVLNPNGIATMTLLRQELCNSAQQTYGWLPRLRKNDPGSNTQIVRALGANAFGNAILTVTSTAGFNINPLGPLVVGGMRGLQKYLNGTYLPSAYTIIDLTSIGLSNRQTGLGVPLSYSGTGTVRLAAPSFSAYAPNQAIPTTSGVIVSIVRARDTGRPFFLTHGRQ